MFKQEDLAKYLGLKKIIAESYLEIKGEAAITVASHIIWFNELEKKIREDITPSQFKPIGTAKPIKDNKI